ncbi:Tex family protein [Sinomonas atrocyanea]|uniref:Tex family protein n=1 Tax=Sinomonas atrocyanea TaxID=37927 RepID=UPI0027D80169|nr:Tex family protein [Sinomonas atrocyanea]
MTTAVGGIGHSRTVSTETSLPQPSPAVPSPPGEAETAEAIARTIAAELGVAPWQVKAAVGLIDGGATVPFIARYRKEATGTLDDAQLRDLEERLRYLRELEDRRRAILAAVAEQGALTEELRAALLAATTKSELEDLYLPYKSKRRTRAQVAREAGLEPLADSILADPSQDLDALAESYLNEEKGITGAAEALAGARAILTERAGQDAALVADLRERLFRGGRLRSAAKAGGAGAGTAATAAEGKYADFEDYVQPVDALPGHRVLALLRGEREGALSLEIAEADPRDEAARTEARAAYEAAVARALGVHGGAGTPAGKWLAQTVKVAWQGRLLAKLESDLRARLFDAAEEESVKVFAANLRDVLLAAPAGNRAVLGLDPGLRTGVKVAVVDGTGKVLDTATVYPHAPAKKWDESLAVLEKLARRHNVELVAVGNGTASRETDRLAGDLLARIGLPRGSKVIVSEAGASVYSASALASAELPDLDVSLRGAVSIARRLQDPLAELVKIDPKSIGVGQYQHDVTQSKLERTLDAVVEDCVNAVGVDVNTASPALLARVAGLGPTLSRNIVEYRDAHGAFASRAELKEVPRLGAKAFEQCAGFLRITGGSEPLDASAVHPEAYGLAGRILTAAGGSKERVATLDPTQFADERFGLPTVRDVMTELVRPGRDPRPEFVTASLTEGVETINDLRPGMILEGTVSNVAAFGAFVDLGVHQDGLVHVSAMSTKFISDPREVVQSGQVVKVKVLDVDVPRKRISLTLRLDDEPGGERGERKPARGGEDRRRAPGGGNQRSGNQNGGNQRSGGAPTGRGQRDSGGQPGAAQRGGKAQPAADTALADALRRAGLAR